MKMARQLDYRLRWMDFDRYGRMQPSAILDMFQDVATVHAEELGIGRDDLLARGVFWVVVRSKFEIVEAPEHYHVVTARTWPHTLTRFSFMRDFSMLDEGGRLLVKATTEWVLMDVESRKFVSVKDYCDVPDDYDEERSFERKPRKIPDFAEGNRPVHVVVPGYSDIDVNGHVNNARYADYVIDALNPGEGACIRTFQIDYRHEVLPGVPLHVHTLVEDARVLAKGVNEQGQTSFACLIELQRFSPLD